MLQLSILNSSKWQGSVRLLPNFQRYTVTSVNKHQHVLEEHSLGSGEDIYIRLIGNINNKKLNIWPFLINIFRLHGNIQQHFLPLKKQEDLGISVHRGQTGACYCNLPQAGLSLCAI